MRKTNFLKKLHDEKKLELVEPSEEIKESYLKKSEVSLGSAKILFKSEHFEDAVSMAYYSMYYSLTALLFKTGVKCENHSGAIMLLKELFNIDNKQIAFAKKERIDKQYYVDFKVTKNEVSEMIVVAEEFNKNILHVIETMKKEDISNYRKLFLTLIKK